jgi:predicted alpha/beta superfamily hydrolase
MKNYIGKMIKKIILLITISISTTSLNGQNESQLSRGKIDTIYSKILNENRELWVYQPNEKDSKKKYPVIYLLDGNHHFHTVVSMVEQLSSGGNNVFPKMIIVAIPNTNRSRDLSPTNPDNSHPFSPKEFDAGGDKFLSFIENEVFKHIDTKYNTAPYKVFIGHSLGGLLVMHTLFKKPELFNSYVAIDPAMWWSQRNLLNTIKNENLNNNNNNNKSLYLAIANTMSSDLDTTTVKKDKSYQTDPIRANLELDSILKKKNNLLRFKSKYYPNESHGSLPLIAEYDALHYIFSFYQINIDNKDYFDKSYDIYSKVVNHFDEISTVLGYKVKPEEDYINGLGYDFLTLKQYIKSEKFFILNTKNYPKSYNTFDSLGEFYMKIGEKDKARLNFNQSIRLNENSPSKEKIKLIDN